MQTFGASIGISRDHLHLSEVDADLLGVREAKPIRWLGMGSNWASDTKLNVEGRSLRLVLPFREYSQIEFCPSTCLAEGIYKLPLCNSGDGGKNGCVKTVTNGSATVEVKVICSVPHVHVGFSPPKEWAFIETEQGSLSARVWHTGSCFLPVLHLDSDMYRLCFPSLTAARANFVFA